MTQIDPKAVEAALVAANDAANEDDSDHAGIIIAALAAALPILEAGIRAEAIENAAKIADHAQKHAVEWAEKYPDAARRMEDRAHEAKMIAAAIRAAIPAAPSHPVGNGEGEG